MNAADVVISDHAVSRYHERVKPALLREDARRDLVRILEQLGEIEILERPPWPLPPGQVYALLAEGICFAGHLSGPKFFVKTVMVNAAMSERTRARRRERKAKRRSERRDREARQNRVAALRPA